jgi:chaperonin GroES
MNFKPLRDGVLIKPEAEESMTKSGIILVNADRVKPIFGKIVAIGDQVVDAPIGTQVAYNKVNKGKPVEVSGEKYLLLREQELLGKL